MCVCIYRYNCLVAKSCPTLLQPHGLQPYIYIYVCVCVCVCTCVLSPPVISNCLWSIPWTVALLSMEFSRQEYWSGLSLLYIILSLLFSHSVMSTSLWPHGLQHSRLPCPSPSPGICSNSCPLRQWCHPTISSSVVPYCAYLQSFQHQDIF